MKTLLRLSLDVLHRCGSRSRFAVWLALKIRNQANAVLSKRLGETHRSELNGEYSLASCIAPHCLVAFDVGANAGDWTDNLVRSGPAAGLRVYAFEPGEHAYSVLRTRFADTHTVRLFNTGLSDGEGEGRFIEDNANSELSRFVTLEESITDGRMHLVPLTTVDHVIAREGLETVDFIKVDTEGHDLRVIQGAREALTRQSIGILQFEYGATWIHQGATLAQALCLLGTSGYTVYLLRRSGLWDFAYPKWGECFFYSNFVAVSPRWDSAIAHLRRGAI